MIKKLFITIFLSFCAISANAETVQIKNAGPSAISTAGSTFLYLQGTSIGTTEGFRQVIAPSSGTFRNMRVLLSAAPDNGAGTDSVLVSLRVEGASTALSCTISESATTCTDSDSVSVSAGNSLSYIVTASNTPSAATVEVTIEYVDGTDNFTMQNFGAATTVDATANTYFSLAVSSFSDTENNVQMPMPTTGTIKNMYVELTGSPANGGGTQSYVFTLFKNGSTASSTTCTISEAATTCNDTTNSFTFVAGDTITIECDPVGTPTVRAVMAGIVFQMDVEGEFILPSGNDGVMDATTTQYKGITHGGGWNATESAVDQASNIFTVKAIYVAATADPDLGLGIQSYDFTVRDDTNSTGCTCQIASGAVACNDTCDNIVAVDSQMSVQQVPTTLPTAVGANIGILGFRRPSLRIMTQ